jgi:hypothetical protein
MNRGNFFTELKRRKVFKVGRGLSGRGVALGSRGHAGFPFKRGTISQGCLLTENQISGNLAFMKTTLDLPDELMREVKIRAVHEHKKLKDAIAEFIRRGMAAGKPGPAKVPKPIKLRRGFVPTAEDIEAAIAWGRD